MVNILRMIQFECKKQVASFTFLIVIFVFTVFAITQISEIFYMPVNSESDIYALERSGEHKYIFIPNTDVELKESAVEFLQQRISEGTISADNDSAFTPVFEMLLDDSYTFDDVLTAMNDDDIVFPWLIAIKTQFGERIGSVEEVNNNLRMELEGKGYSSALFEKYVTYIQVISAFLVFPMFLLLFTRDYRYNMYEIIYTQPVSSTKYILCRYVGIFFPLVAYLYFLGLVLNLISVSRFVDTGYEISYTPFITYFAICLLPTIYFFCSLITLLMLCIKKAIAVFPIYIMYVMLNATPDVFGLGNDWVGMLNPIIRLDREVGEIGIIIANRIFYLILGTLCLVIACKVYDKSKRDLRKVITI